MCLMKSAKDEKRPRAVPMKVMTVRKTGHMKYARAPNCAKSQSHVRLELREAVGWIRMS